MATVVMLKKGNLTKKGFVGFSWTTLFFGVLVPVIRFDIVGIVVAFILTILTWGLFQLVFCFVYNKFYTVRLLRDGWEPLDKESERILRERSYLAAAEEGFGFKAKPIKVDIDIKKVEKDTKELKCWNCGEKIKSGDKFCSKCGSEVNKKRVCSSCGKEVGQDSEYCSYCGKKL